MYEVLIKNYIDSLTIDDVILLAQKRNIDLNREEATVLLDIVKKNFSTFYKGDATELILELEKKIRKEPFDQLKQLYIEAKNKWL